MVILSVGQLEDVLRYLNLGCSTHMTKYVPNAIPMLLTIMHLNLHLQHYLLAYNISCNTHFKMPHVVYKTFINLRKSQTLIPPRNSEIKKII